MTIMHSRNAFIQELREYDKDKRILSEMTSEGIAEIQCSSCTLVLPKTRVVKKYRYDDFDGNTRQTAILDILEPTEKAIDPQKFSFAFPEGARVFDTMLALYSDQLESISLSIAHDLLDHDAAIMGTEEEHTGETAGAARLRGDQKVMDDGDRISSDPTGSKLMAQVREAYARDTLGRSGAALDPREERGLRLPTSNFAWVLMRKVSVLVAGTAALLLAVRFVYRRIADSTHR
jgi:hypothetical protein